MTVRTFLYELFMPWLPILREEGVVPRWALTASLLILAVLLIRALLKEKISLRIRYALWAVVALRLLIPVQLPLSLPAAPAGLVEELPYQLTYPTVPMYPTAGAPDAVSSEMRYSDNHTQAIFTQTLPDGEQVSVTVPIWSRYQVFLLIWWGGVLTVAGAVAASNLHFYGKLKKRRTPLEVEDGPLPVYTAEGLPSPCLFGVLRPAVYVTPEVVEHPDTLRHVLAHELTHYAHRDHLWAAARCLCLALHWYNPLVWLAAVLSKRDGELACDEGAVTRLGEAERIPYGRTLVDMVAARSGRPADLLSCSTAMTGGKKSIHQRVAQLVRRPETATTALFAAAAAVALSVVFVFAGQAQIDSSPHMLLSYLDRTEIIRYSPPLYSSFFYAAPIADEDLLAEAKEVLSTFTYLSDDDPQPDLSANKTFHEHRIVLLFGGGQAEYSLLWQNNRTYLFQGSIWELSLATEEEGENARLLGVSGTYVSETGVNAVNILESLARQQMERGREPWDSSPTPFTYFYQYHSQLAAAQGMRRNSPMLHNNRIITDRGQLERTRELLALEPLTEEEASWVWDGVWDDIISFTPTPPDPDWTGTDDNSLFYYVSYEEDGQWYILRPTEREDERLSGIYLGKLPAGNWDLAYELFEKAPTVDERQHAAGLAGGSAYRVTGDEYPEALEALTQLFVNDETFLSQNAQAHNTTPENIASWLSGENDEHIAPEILVVGFAPWTLSAFGDGSLLFIDLTIPDHMTAQIESICQSFGVTPRA